MWLTTAVGLLQPAGAGDLDPSFGDDGRVSTAFAEPASAVAMTIDAEGRTLVVENMTTVDPRTANGNKVAIARYTRGGRLDSSFSDDRKTVLGLPVSRILAEDVAIEADGRSSLTRASVEASVAHEPGDRDAAAVT